MKLCPTLLHEADKQKSDLKSYECIFYATAIQFVQIELFEKVTYFRMTTFYCCLLLLVLNADQQAKRNFSISPGKKTIFSASVHSSLSIYKKPIQVNFLTTERSEVVPFFRAVRARERERGVAKRPPPCGGEAPTKVAK